VTWLSGCNQERLPGERSGVGVVGEHGRNESKDGKLWNVAPGRQELAEVGFCGSRELGRRCFGLMGWPKIEGCRWAKQ